MRTFPLAPLFALLLICALVPIRATALDSRLVHDGDVDFRVVTIDLGAEPLDLYWLDANGAAYGSIERLRQGGEAIGQTLAFATNAGIYDRSDRPLGLTIAGGRMLRPLNTTKPRGGSGNSNGWPGTSPRCRSNSIRRSWSATSTPSRSQTRYAASAVA